MICPECSNTNVRVDGGPPLWLAICRGCEHSWYVTELELLKDANMAGKKSCSESGCNRKIVARGLCSKHYERARYAGNFTSRSRKPGRKSSAERGASPKNEDPAGFKKQLRKIISAQDDGFQIILEVDGRSFVLQEVELAPKG